MPIKIIIFKVQGAFLVWFGITCLSVYLVLEVKHV